MTRRLAVCAVSVALGLIGSTASVPSAAASSAASRRALVPFTGYLWSTSTAPTSLENYYAFNSAGGSVSISHPATGQYSLTFDSVGVLFKPFVSVSTYDGIANCGIPILSSSAGQLQIFIACFSFTGSPVDARFDLLVGEPGGAPRGVVDYALVTGPDRLNLSYNSSRNRNSVRHLGAGRYELIFGGPATTGITGTVKVSAASTAASCQVAGWRGTRAGEAVFVDCFSASGNRHNEVFYVGYARHGNLTGIKGATTADAFASRPSAASYRPAVQDNNTTGAHVAVRRMSRGDYVVTFARSSGPSTQDGGDVQVTAVGTRDRHCYVVGWTIEVNPQAEIACADNHGNSIDTPFTVQWINDSSPV